MNLSNKQFDFLMGCLLVFVLGFTLSKAYVAEKSKQANLDIVYPPAYTNMTASVQAQ